MCTIAVAWLALLTVCAQATHSFGQKSIDSSANEYRSHSLVCQRRNGGAYCSAGKTAGYIGPLDSAAQLKRALQATEYKKEVIITSETRIVDVSQFVARMRGRAGYGHVLTVLAALPDCKRLARVLSPWQQAQGPVSCGAYAVNDDSGQPYAPGFRYLRIRTGLTAWWLKWFTVARAVALGYNVLAVDSDVVVLDDWYWRAKQPPLSSYQLLSQAECPICINGGFSYIQNANPAGPVAWMFYEAVHRAVRWTEDWSAVAALSDKCAADPSRVSYVDDQTMLTDVLWSCVTGRPQFGALGFFLRDDPAAMQRLQVANEAEFRERNTPAANFTDVVDYHQHFMTTYSVDGELAAAVCEHFGSDAPLASCGPAQQRHTANATIRTAALHMPHSGSAWPLPRGGYPFNRTAGPRTAAYRAAFADLGVRLPPDPEDPATQQAAANTPAERFGLLSLFAEPARDYMGGWAESVWAHTGRLGYWHTHLGAPPWQGVGHTHASLFPGDFQKQIIMQAAGQWDWRVATRLGGAPSRSFYASYAHADAFLGAQQGNATDIPRLVAYRPGVIRPGISKAQFLAAARGLAQVAVALGAVAAWPAVPCDAEWALSAAGRNMSRPIRHSIPWLHLNTQFVVMPFGDSLDTLQCEWLGFASIDCLMDRQMYGLNGGRGMLAMEFNSLLTRRRRRRLAAVSGSQASLAVASAGAALASPGAGGGHTLQLPQQGGGGAAGASSSSDDGGGSSLGDGSISSSNSSDELVTVRHTDLLQLNAPLLLLPKQARGHIPVLWLDRPVGEVAGLEGEAKARFDTWRLRCRALHFGQALGHDLL